MISEYANKPVKLYLHNGEMKRGVVQIFDAMDEDVFCLVDSTEVFKSSYKDDLINVPSVEEIELLNICVMYRSFASLPA